MVLPLHMDLQTRKDACYIISEGKFRNPMIAVCFSHCVSIEDWILLMLIV